MNNFDINRIFQNIQTAWRGYVSEVTATLSAYRQQLSEARQKSAAYVDSRGEFERSRETLIAVSRERITEADEALCDTVKGQLSALRNALGEHITRRANPSYISLLRDYKDFQVKLSKLELSLLASKSEGNYQALQLLGKLAEESGYRMTVPTVSDYEGDLHAIERLTYRPIMCAPLEYAAEAVDVFEDVPYRRADGSVVYTTGRPDTTYLSLQAAAFKKIEETMASASDRWTASFVPDLVDLKPLKGADGETITPEEQRAEAAQRAVERVEIEAEAEDLNAAALATQNAAAAAQSQSIIAAYTR